MISPVSSNNYLNALSQTVQPVQSLSSSTRYASSSQQSVPATQQLKSDSVTISTNARALSLYQQGLPVEQIALRLGVDADAVRGYLGLQTEETAAALARTAVTAQNLLQATYETEVDISTIRNYFGTPQAAETAGTYQTTKGLSGNDSGQ